MTSRVFKLRKDLRLIDATDPREPLWIEDVLTSRTFRLPRSEIQLFKLLRKGVTLAALSRAMKSARITSSPENYASIYERLCLTEPLPPDFRFAIRRDVESRILDRLRRAWNFSTTRVPYYRKLKKKLRLTGDWLCKLESWTQHLPILDRVTYRSHFPEKLLPEGKTWFSLSRNPRYVLHSSSGTTEERVQILHSTSHLDKIFHSRFLHEDVFSDPHAFMAPLHCMSLHCFREIPPFEERYSETTLHLAATNILGQTPEEAGNLLQELSKTRIRNLVANPFYLAYTTRQALSRKKALPRIKKLYLSYDFLQETTKDYFRKIYGTIPITVFGMIEGGFQLMRACAFGSLHLNEEFFHFEFLPYPECRAFRLVFTALENRTVPLFRYETTDLFRDESGRNCPCGSPFRSVPGFEGRIKDIVKLSDRNFTLGELDRALGILPGVIFYQLWIRGNSLEFRYFPEPGVPDEVTKKSVQERLENFLKCSLDLRIVPCENFVLARSEKFPVVNYL